MKRALLIATCACWALPANAQDDGELRLAPTSVWAVNYADDSCELARTFGAGEQEVTLFFRANSPGGRFLISAFGKPLEVTQPVTRIFVNLGGEEQLQAAFFALRNPDGLPGLQGLQLLSVGPIPNPRETEARIGLPGVLAVDPANERRVNYVALQSVLARDIVFETGSMGEPLAALRACTEELVSHWGVDVEKQRTLSSRASPLSNPQTWIRSTDYPGRTRRNGFVNYRLIVDEKGDVAECAIQGATQPAAFADIACSRLERRAEFSPALDAAGQPIRSYHVGSVIFLFPG